jgi:hypothetical protein|tara:strand:+ start:502 stop:798 length:297 start_codon:yes stop_codon:yes gene_type:complete
MLRRKKSKYKQAVVGDKKYYYYRIYWLDPCGDAGHAEASEVKKLKPAKMITHAFIFDKDSKHVWTFASYDEESAVFSDRNVLLRSSVTKMEKVLNRSE